MKPLRPLAFLLAGSALAAVLTTAALSYAGSYLDRSAILLGDTRRANEWLLTHLADREMAELIHDVAEARLKSARKMSVPVSPKEVAMAHPHLLMTLEVSERAAAAAAAGQNEKFLAHLRHARDEDATFRSLLSAAKLDLPALPDKNDKK
jgi:recombinational DNA repair ATPase RecF